MLYTRTINPYLFGKFGFSQKVRNDPSRPLFAFVIEMCVDVSGGRKGTVPQPFLNLLHRYAVHHHQAGAAVAQIVEADAGQAILPKQPVEVLRHEVRADQLAFLIGADEIQINHRSRW